MYSVEVCEAIIGRDGVKRAKNRMEFAKYQPLLINCVVSASTQVVLNSNSPR